MTISVRLDDALEHDLESVALRTGLSKSYIIKQSLKEYLAKQTPQATAYELGEDLFGQQGSGGDSQPANKERIRQRIVERVRAKNNR